MTLMDKWLHFAEIALEPAGFPPSPPLPRTELPGRHFWSYMIVLLVKSGTEQLLEKHVAECFSAPHVASPIGILKVQFET